MSSFNNFSQNFENRIHEGLLPLAKFNTNDEIKVNNRK